MSWVVIFFYFFFILVDEMWLIRVFCWFAWWVSKMKWWNNGTKWMKGAVTATVGGEKWGEGEGKLFTFFYQVLCFVWVASNRSIHILSIYRPNFFETMPTIKSSWANQVCIGKKVNREVRLVPLSFDRFFPFYVWVKNNPIKTESVASNQRWEKALKHWGQESTGGVKGRERKGKERETVMKR